MFQHAMFEKMSRLTYDQALTNAIRLVEKLESKGVNVKRLPKEEVVDALQFYGVPHLLSNTKFRLGPLALTTTLTTNIFNPGTTTGGVACTAAPFDKLYVILNYVYILNKTGSAATASLWIGATGANAAGTEFYVSATSVPANSMLSPPFVGVQRMSQADFLVGGAGTATALTLIANGEIGVGA